MKIQIFTGIVLLSLTSVVGKNDTFFFGELLWEKYDGSLLRMNGGTLMERNDIYYIGTWFNASIYNRFIVPPSMKKLIYEANFTVCLWLTWGPEDERLEDEQILKIELNYQAPDVYILIWYLRKKDRMRIFIRRRRSIDHISTIKPIKMNSAYAFYCIKVYIDEKQNHNAMLSIDGQNVLVSSIRILDGFSSNPARIVGDTIVLGTSKKSPLKWRYSLLRISKDFNRWFIPPGCLKNLCSGNGNCIPNPEVEETVCVCNEGYFESDCSGKDSCTDKPCQNGGTCQPVSNPLYSTNFTCKCIAGRFGATCENIFVKTTVRIKKVPNALFVIPKRTAVFPSEKLEYMFACRNAEEDTLFSKIFEYAGSHGLTFQREMVNDLKFSTNSSVLRDYPSMPNVIRRSKAGFWYSETTRNFSFPGAYTLIVYYLGTVQREAMGTITLLDVIEGFFIIKKDEEATKGVPFSILMTSTAEIKNTMDIIYKFSDVTIKEKANFTHIWMNDSRVSQLVKDYGKDFKISERGVYISTKSLKMEKSGWITTTIQIYDQKSLVATASKVFKSYSYMDYFEVFPKYVEGFVGNPIRLVMIGSMDLGDEPTFTWRVQRGSSFVIDKMTDTNCIACIEKSLEGVKVANLSLPKEFRSWNFEQRFSMAGNFQISVLAKNRDVQVFVRNVSVSIIKSMSVLSVHTPPKRPNFIKDLLHFYGFVTDRGDSASFVWYFENVPIPDSKVYAVTEARKSSIVTALGEERAKVFTINGFYLQQQHTYFSSGEHKISLVGFNKGKQTREASITVYVLGMARQANLYLSRNVMTAGNNVTFVTTVIDAAENSTYKLTITDRDRVTLRMLKTQAVSTITDDVTLTDTAIKEHEKNGFLYAKTKRTMWDVGKHEITFIILQEAFVTKKAVETITVVQLICNITVSVTNAGQTTATAIRYKSRDPVVLGYESSVVCDNRKLTHRKWTIHSIDKYQAGMKFNDQNKVPQPATVQNRRPEFKIEANSIPPGLYAVKVVVEIKQDRLIAKAEGIGWIEIVKPELKAVISGGNQIVHYYTETLIIDGSESEMTDLIRKEAKFEWFCSTEQGEAVTACKGMNKPLSTSEKKLEFSPKTFDPEGVYRFRLMLTAGKDADSSTAEQFVSMNRYASLSIECSVNCDDKVNPAEVLSLEAKCEACNAMVFSWTVTGGPDMDESCFPEGRSQQMHLNVKENCLEQGVKYKVNLKASMLTVNLEANYEFLTNSPPRIGSCVIEPKEGETMRTRFFINCKDFQDDDEPLTYDFYYNNDYSTNNKVKHNFHHGDVGMLLTKRTDPKADDIFLPYGNPAKDYSASIIVTVTDYRGMCVEYVIDVRVTPPKSLSISELKSYVFGNESGSFKDILQTEGEYEGALSMASSIGMVMLSPEVENITHTEKAEIKKFLIEEVAKIPPTKFDSSKAIISTMGSLLEGPPQEVPIDVADEAAEVIDTLTDEMVKQMEDEPISAEMEFDAAMTSFKAATTLGKLHVANQPILTIVPENFSHELTEETEKIHNVSKKVVTLIDKVSEMVLHNQPPSDEIVQVESDNVTLIMKKLDSHGETTGEMSIEGAEKMVFPPLSSLGVNGSQTKLIDISMTRLPYNPFYYSKYGELINTNVLKLKIYDANTKEELDTTKEKAGVIEYFVEWKGTVTAASYNITTGGLPEIREHNLGVHNVNISTKGVSLHLLIERDRVDYSLLVTWTYNRKPILEDFKKTKLVVTAENNATHLMTFLAEEEMVPEEGTYYVGVLPFSDTLRYLGRNDMEFAFRNSSLSPQLQYTLNAYVSRCMHHIQDEWTDLGCKVGNKTDFKQVHCICNHTSVYGASFLVVMNEVDSIDVSEFPPPKTGKKISWILVAFVVLCWLLYTIGMLWAVGRDHQDIHKKDLLYLGDRTGVKPYGYIIKFYTGLRWFAGTSSKVSFQLHGRKAESKQWDVAFKKLATLKKGGQDYFVFLTEKHVGEVVGLTLTIHFNGTSPSWFLRQVKVKDLATGRVWIFLINEWYIPKGKISKVEDFVAPLKPHEVRSCKNVLQRRAVSDFRERHLWFSIFQFPPRSNFTRVQRLTCTLATFTVAMLVNLWFSDVEPGLLEMTEYRPLKETLLIGLIGSNYEPFIVSLYGCGISFAFALFVCEIFRRIEYPKLREKNQVKSLLLGHEDVDHLKRDAYYPHLRYARLESPIDEEDTAPREELLSSDESVRSWQSEVQVKQMKSKSRGIFEEFSENLFSDRSQNFCSAKGLKPPLLRKENASGDMYYERKYGLLAMGGHQKLLAERLFEAGDYHKPRKMQKRMDFASRETVESTKEVYVENEGLRCRKFSLRPYWLYFAWLTAFGTAFVCTSLVIWLGLPFKDIQSILWIKSCIFSFAESVLILEPFQILMFTLFMGIFVEAFPS